MKIPLQIPLCLAALGLLTLAARAQRSAHPMPPRPPFVPPLPRQQLQPNELQLQSQRATVSIESGASARVRLVQTFLNPAPIAIEGTYLWSVPPGAAIGDLSVTLGGKKIAAEILDADKAREIYTNIVRQKRDPAILEFVGRDLVRARIFPVPAGGKVEVELGYSQPLSDNRFTLPLRAPGSDNPVDAALDLTFKGREVKAVYSPSHPIETVRSGDETRVTGEWKATDRDFSLLWTRGTGAIALDLLNFQKPGEDGYFLLLAAPDASANQTPVKAKDVTFVFDTSGSMNDDGKIEQARRALQTLLSNLSAADRFNIITFASDVRPFRAALTPATPQNLAAARGFVGDIKAVGGTNIDAALQSALKEADAKSKRPQQVIFLTDGLPTVGETSVETLLNQARQQNEGAARVWTFGVGEGVNTRLLDGLASENGGASDYVLPREDIETKVGALYEKIAYPILTDLQLNWNGLETYDVYPRRLPDLFRGGQMVVMGRYKGAPKTVALSGQIAGAPRSFAGKSGAGGDELPKLWATRKIGFLIDDARRANRPLDGEVRDEILKLAGQYGIVTPLTAALVTEDQPLSGPIGMLGDVPGRRADNNIFRGDARDNSGGFGGGGRARVGAGVAAFDAQTGAGAVAASKATAQLREGYAAPLQNASVKTSGGKTFVLRDGVWTDSAYDAAKFPAPQVIKFGSDAYFDLLQNKQLAQWLSVGEAVVWVNNGVAVRVEK